MKLSAFLCLVPSLTPVLLGQTAAPSRIQLDIQRDAAQLTLRWAAQSRNGDGTVAYPAFQLQSSDDLRQWTTFGPTQRGSDTQPFLSANVAATREHAFYRLVANPSRVGKAGLGSGGAEVFGYGDALDQALADIGQITPREFAARFPSPANYLPGIDRDPTTVDFWPQFNLDSELHNLGLIDGVDDLPVFIGTDPILQAWHRSYDADPAR